MFGAPVWVREVIRQQPRLEETVLDDAWLLTLQCFKVRACLRFEVVPRRVVKSRACGFTQLVFQEDAWLELGEANLRSPLAGCNTFNTCSNRGIDQILLCLKCIRVRGHEGQHDTASAQQISQLGNGAVVCRGVCYCGGRLLRKGTGLLWLRQQGVYTSTAPYQFRGSTWHKVGEAKSGTSDRSPSRLVGAVSEHLQCSRLLHVGLVPSSLRSLIAESLESAERLVRTGKAQYGERICNALCA